MGGQRYSVRVLEWAQVYGETFTTSQAMHALGLDGKQAQNVLRRFANEGKLEQLGTRSWRAPQLKTSSNEDGNRAGDNYGSPARRAREVTRAVAPITFEQVDVFTDGASLLRSDDGEFYRGYITKLN